MCKTSIDTLNDKIPVKNVSANDLKSLHMLAEEQKLKRYICVSLEAVRRRSAGIDILPYREFLERLWRRALV